MFFRPLGWVVVLLFCLSLGCGRSFLVGCCVGYLFVFD